MNNCNNLIFIGTRGTVLGIDQFNGKELWRTTLPGSLSAPVTIFFEDGKVFCGSNGKVYILCSKSGKILAQNDMIGQGYGVITFTTKKTDAVQQSQQMQQPQMVQQPRLVIQQPQQLMNEQYVQDQPQQQQQQQQQPFMLESPQSFQQNIQPPMYQPIPVQQQMFFEQSQSQSQQNNNNNQQQPLLTQMYPSFSLNDDLDDESQSLLHNDEEIARSLDIELNGNINRNRNNNNRNNLVIHDNNRLSNHLNPNNRLMNLSDLNNFINNRHSQNRNNNGLNLFRENFNGNNNYYVQQPQQEISIDDIIFVGLNAYVTAISKITGQEVWRTCVPTSFGLPISMIFTKDKINVASSGQVFCLNAYTGKMLWRNKLPGLRYGNVSVITSTNNNTFYNANSTLLTHEYH